MDDATTAPVGTGTTPTSPSDSSVSNRKTELADAFRTHFSGDAPLLEKAKGFAKERPWTSAAFLGIAAIAVLKTLGGRR